MNKIFTIESLIVWSIIKSFAPFQIASELNSALLKAENAECCTPKLAGLLKLLLWCQQELDRKGISYTKIVDLSGGKIMKVESK